MEEQSQGDCRRRRDSACDDEQRLEVRYAVRRVSDHHRGAKRIGDDYTDAENHDVEQALRAGAGVLREIFIDENVNRREEERVTNAVQQKDKNDEASCLREKCEYAKARNVA